MSDDDQLLDSIEAAEKRVRELEEVAARSAPDKSASGARTPVLFVLAVLCTIASFIIFRNANNSVQEDIVATQLDFIMEADAEVLAYHELFGELPVEMPDYALRNFVSYQRLGSETYRLMPLLGSEVVIARELSEVLDPALVRQSLQQ